jgi:hypothetical protein
LIDGFGFVKVWDRKNGVSATTHHLKTRVRQMGHFESKSPKNRMSRAFARMKVGQNIGTKSIGQVGQNQKMSHLKKISKK